MSEWNARSNSEGWDLHAGFSFVDTFAGLALSGLAPTLAVRMRLYIYLNKGTTAGSITYIFNSDVGSNYAFQDLTGSSTALSGARVTGAAKIDLNTHEDQDNDTPGLYIVEIFKPLAGEKAHIQSRSAYVGASGVALMYERHAAEWDNTVDLINSIIILFEGGNGAVGGRIELEMIGASS